MSKSTSTKAVKSVKSTNVAGNNVEVNETTLPNVPVVEVNETTPPVVEVAPAASTESKARVTLNSTLTAGDANGLAGVLIGKAAGDEAVLNAMVATLTAALVQVPLQLQALKDKIEADTKAAAEAKAAEEKLATELEAYIAEQKRINMEDMIKKMVSMGATLEVAQAAVMGNTGSTKEKKTYERVTVNYNGQVIELPKRGNLSQTAKDAMKAAGMENEREAFIAKYEVKQVADETNA